MPLTVFRVNGSFLRMKEIMEEHVETNKTSMFETTTGRVKAMLDNMCNTIEGEMSRKMKDIVETVAHNYSMILIGCDVNSMSTSPQTTEVRVRLLKLLRDVDQKFVNLRSPEEGRDIPGQTSNLSSSQATGHSNQDAGQQGASHSAPDAEQDDDDVVIIKEEPL
jgi:hypothetical protein